MLFFNDKYFLKLLRTLCLHEYIFKIDINLNIFFFELDCIISHILIFWLVRYFILSLNRSIKCLRHIKFYGLKEGGMEKSIILRYTYAR